MHKTPINFPHPHHCGYVHGWDPIELCKNDSIGLDETPVENKPPGVFPAGVHWAGGVWGNNNVLEIPERKYPSPPPPPHHHHHHHHDQQQELWVLDVYRMLSP